MAKTLDHDYGMKKIKRAFFDIRKINRWQVVAIRMKEVYQTPGSRVQSYALFPASGKLL